MSTPEQSKRILFVDDERSVLTLLQAVCRRIGPDWDVSFADNGSKALQLMAENPFDVVVSDMRMPEMSGVDLLQEVMERYPKTARIILSGYADQQVILRSLGATHQYLSKPCDMAVLGSTILRILALNHTLNDERLKEVMRTTPNVPNLPTLYLKLMKELASPEATTESVAALISEDMNLTAKLLQLVNSAFFGVAHPVGSAKDAVQILGFSTVKTLALLIYVFSQFDPEKMPEFPLERLWRHSMATGLLARRIAAREGGDLGVIEAAFAAGALHDIGKLILGFSLPQLYQSALDQASERRVPPWQVESEVIGAGHGELGAYLLDSWGLPSAIVEAVAWHHQPRKREPLEFCALTAVHVANYVHGRRTPVSVAELPAQLDRDYVDAMRLSADISTWEADQDAQGG